MKNYLNQTDKTVEDELHDECGVFGAYDFDGNDVASTIYYGLFALQHRGQESCGIAVSDTEGPKGKVLAHKDMGLVNEVFNAKRKYRCWTCQIFHSWKQCQRKCPAIGFKLCKRNTGTCSQR